MHLTMIFRWLVALPLLWVCSVATAAEGNSAMHDDMPEIAQLILHWGYYRDHGMWEELADTFHPDGQIQVTWYVGPFAGFVEASRVMAQQGSSASHVMSSPIIDLEGERAIAITPVEIRGRATIALGVEVDMVSQAQFFDFVEKRAGKWRILRRVCIYQKDRIDSVTPSIRYWLLSMAVPGGKYEPAYRNLGFVLERQGYEVKPGQVVDNTEAARRLYEQGLRWLAGGQE